MSDYFQELRGELVAAAARERARSPVRRALGRRAATPPPRRPRRGSLVVVLVCLLLGAVPAAAITGLWRPGGAGQEQVKPRPNSLRIEARAPDPDGGPDWAVRVWRSASNQQACVQLGRFEDGRFGRLDRSGGIEVLGLAAGDGARCSSEVFDSRDPIVAVETIVDDPGATKPRALRTVAYGLAGPQAERVTLRARGARVSTPRSPRQAFIALFDGAVRTYEVTTTVEYRSGARRTIDYLRGPRGGERPLSGSAAVEATAADPAGRRRWGLLVWENAAGGICEQYGRLIAGDRVGTLAPSGSFFDYPLGDHGPCVERSHPFAHRLSTTAPLPGETGQGHIVLHGVARGDVATVTVGAFGEKRVLIPSRRGGVLAVYAGRREGDVRLDVAFKDGRRQTVGTFSLGREPDFPRPQRGLGSVGPRSVRVSRDGVATLLVSCPSERGRTRCLGSLYLITEPHRRSRHGLERSLRLGSHYIRIARGTRRRPLRFRLTRRGLRLLRERGRLDAIATERSDGDLSGERRWRITLVSGSP